MYELEFKILYGLECENKGVKETTRDWIKRGCIDDEDIEEQELEERTKNTQKTILNNAYALKILNWTLLYKKLKMEDLNIVIEELEKCITELKNIDRTKDEI